MKSKLSRALSLVIATAFVACTSHRAQVPAAEPPIMDATYSQLRFSAPDQALAELAQAVKPENRDRLTAIFGPEAKSLLQSGDPVEDENKFQAFAALVGEEASFVPAPVPPDDQGAPRVLTLVVGHSQWPFPIPLKKEKGGWRFDTANGKEEIISRRIGENELCAIALCAEYTNAQLEYILGEYRALLKQAPAGEGRVKDAKPATPAYATKFISTPGKHDGLYWESKTGEAPSPLGPIVAAATEDGYSLPQGHERKPLCGYYFRILTKQGANARFAARNYMRGGSMTDGFAMVAYPSKWGVSGIMTFIVGPDGATYQRDLGANTAEIAKKITSFDPGVAWDPVP